MLQDSRSSVTLFAPVNSAWAHLPSSINLQDAEILQHVVLFLVAGGQIIMPDAVGAGVSGAAEQRWFTRMPTLLT